MLFAFAGGRGHAEPLVPIARAAMAAGHAVTFAGQPSVTATLAAHGFEVAPIGTAVESDPQRLPLRPVDLQHEDRVVADYYAGRLAVRHADALLELMARQLPDVMVCDEMDFGAMVAAERSGVPYASVVVIAAGSFVRPALVREPLNTLRAAYGLPADPELGMLSRHLVLSLAPPSYRDPAFPLPPTARSFRPGPSPVAIEPPPWLAALERPTAYLTLGTIFNVESGDLFARVLAGLRSVSASVVVTVGAELDPTELGPQPSSVRVERYVDQALLLPHCDVVVCHGGSGSVLGALRYGVPLVVIPMGADQPLNAQRCEQLGVGLALDAMTATPAEVRDAVAAVLAEPSYRQAAARLAAELAALPSPTYALELLERLVATHGTD